MASGTNDRAVVVSGGSTLAIRPTSPMASKPGARRNVTRPPRLMRVLTPPERDVRALVSGDPLAIENPVTKVAEPRSCAAALWAQTNTRVRNTVVVVIFF